MKRKVTITFDRPETSFYFCDEILSGTIDFDSFHDLKIDKIKVTLVGEAAYTVGKTRTKFYHVPFLRRKLIMTPFPEQVSEDHYSWPFSIQLPYTSPPTINLIQSYPSIRYYLEVVVIKSWYKLAQRETKQFIIIPHTTNVQYPTIVTNHNRKGVVLIGKVDKGEYFPGETIISTLKINNPKQVVIKHIDVALVECLEVSHDISEHILSTITLPNIVNRHDESILDTFSIKIPSEIYLPPSYAYMFHVHGQKIHIDITYRLKFLVKAEGVLTDFKAILPITIGSNYHPTNNFTHQFFYAIETEELPPQYESPPTYESLFQSDSF
ncbi:unnamed protein product [Didymodactylos carnosus]|uniref:Arrestin C-terminal-like domain-containing protein n=1 Tax=Didymodactylos carnosus TaxID=1234261 RepID=A0A814D8M8_9BILA|nr:unnamed protein product [Didymodactylos carnosus]CAF0951013.1 unnamed protein product [Didymodactylos carnosus]CAF3716600.1 unnamed protein product [Didymodactylos carnosus]CAF3726712.1 unnamed protein product [Didymodactylos carnosus]